MSTFDNKLDNSFVFVLFAMLLIGIISMVTDERSSEPKLYCWYGDGSGVVVYEYECLSTNQFLTDQDEVFQHTSCVIWEAYNGKEKENITK